MNCVCVCFSHERVLECISEQAEEQDIERFQPLLSGMHKNSITLKVKHSHGTPEHRLLTSCHFTGVCVCVCAGRLYAADQRSHQSSGGAGLQDPPEIRAHETGTQRPAEGPNTPKTHMQLNSALVKNK